MQFRTENISEKIQPQRYYNCIRFIDEPFWKEVKFIRDSCSEGNNFLKVVQVMAHIVKKGRKHGV